MLTRGAGQDCAACEAAHHGVPAAAVVRVALGRRGRRLGDADSDLADGHRRTARQPACTAAHSPCSLVQQARLGRRPAQPGRLSCGCRHRGCPAGQARLLGGQTAVPPPGAGTTGGHAASAPASGADLTCASRLKLECSRVWGAPSSGAPAGSAGTRAMSAAQTGAACASPALHSLTPARPSASSAATWSCTACGPVLGTLHMRSCGGRSIFASVRLDAAPPLDRALPAHMYGHARCHYSVTCHACNKSEAICHN